MKFTKVLVAMVTFSCMFLPSKGDQLVRTIEVETAVGARNISLQPEYDNGIYIFEMNATRFRLLEGNCVMAFNQTKKFTLLAKLTTDRPTWLLEPPVLPGEMLFIRGCSRSELDSFDEMHFRVEVPIPQHAKFCGCVDPSKDDKLLDLIDGRQTCVKTFRLPDCEGDPVLLGSSNIPTSQIRSMTKCNTTSCFAGLSLVPFKSDLKLLGTTEATNEADNVHIRRIFNNGSGSIQEVYTAEKTYIDKFSLTRRNSFSNISSDKNVINLGATLAANLSMKPPKYLKPVMSGGIDVSGSLFANFQKAWEKSTNVTKGKESQSVVETKQTRKISQTIIVPPCTAYEVSSSINMLDEVAYSVFYRVTLRSKYIGATSPETIQLLRKLNLTFVEEEDDLTAIYVEKGVSHATLGLDTKITAHATAVNLCNKHEIFSYEVRPSNKNENNSTPNTTVMQPVIVLALLACLIVLMVLIYRWNLPKFPLIKT